MYSQIQLWGKVLRVLNFIFSFLSHSFSLPSQTVICPSFIHQLSWRVLLLIIGHPELWLSASGFASSAGLFSEKGAMNLNSVKGWLLKQMSLLWSLAFCGGWPWRRGNLNYRIVSNWLAPGHVCGANSWSLIGTSAIPEQVGLGYIRKLPEWESK